MEGVVNVTAADIEFLAEETSITIVPAFECGAFKFLRGEVGAFRAPRPVDVPLWLAVSLRRRQRCQIQSPEWLTVDQLEIKLEEEKQTPNAFSQLPEFFFEISSILLDVASEDVRESEACRRLVQDIRDVRATKIRKGLDQIKSSSVIKLNNVTPLEITSVRQFLVSSMNAFHKLSTIPES
eukprot:m.92896 g.92896  ORF g.92896 m.92896 type:complete len:181 (-) comp8902_c0_seq3:1876-2418(-)